MVETVGEDLLARSGRRDTMANGEERLRALIRLIPPARALRDDLDKSIHLELYAGTGDLAVGSFEGLRASVSSISDDPYVGSLRLNVPEAASDKEKVSLALLAAGQLFAYLEGQTGLGGSAKSGNIHYQLAPNVAMGNIEGLGPGGTEKVIEMLSAAMKGKGEREGGSGEA